MTAKQLVWRDMGTIEEPYQLRRPQPRAMEGGALPQPSPATGQQGFLAAAVLNDASAQDALKEAHDAALQSAWQEGRLDGYEEGYQAALKKAQQAMEGKAEQLAQSLVKQHVEQAIALAQQEVSAQAEQSQSQLRQQQSRLKALLQEIPRQREAYVADAEDDMLALAHQAICRILGSEAATVQGLHHQLQQCLKAWHGRAPLSIHLHPDDLPLARADEQITQTLTAAHFSEERATLDWVADADVSLGGCMFRSSEGALDARLDVQLAALKEVLVSTRASRKLLAGSLQPGSLQ